MSNANGSTEAPNSATAEQEAAARKFASVLNETLSKVAKSEQASSIAIMSIIAVLASLPETQNVDPQRVGTIVGALVRGRPDEATVRNQISTGAARIINIAQQAAAARPSQPETEPAQTPQA